LERDKGSIATCLISLHALIGLHRRDSSRAFASTSSARKRSLFCDSA